MTFRPLQVGRVPLSERPGGQAEDVINMQTLKRTVAWEGQESSPPLTQAELDRRHSDVMGLIGGILPVVFSEKPQLNGYYKIVDTGTSVIQWDTEVGFFNWQLRGEYIGRDLDVELESHLVGTATRVNPHGATGERWHAPPPGAIAYGLTTGTPATTVLTGAEGPITVYRGIPAGAMARWSCHASDYGGYRARLLDAAGRERTGTRAVLAATGWQLHNSLVWARWDDAAGLRVAVHDGAAWAEKVWTLSIASGALGVPQGAVLLRNDYECVTLRLLWGRNPGRAWLDLTVRRGSRVVEGHLMMQPASGVVLALATPEATTPAAGYITAAGDDAAGHRFIAGSAGPVTPNTGASSLTAPSGTSMNFMVGAVVGGGAAPAGQQAANLWARYLGTPAESVRANPR